MTYTFSTDSHGRVFLKEEGYGFIAEVWEKQDGTGLAARPVNKGVDMSEDELFKAVCQGVDDALEVR
jgi:hypothetical protein